MAETKDQRIERLRAIAKLPRPNSKGGAFKNKEFAAQQGKIGGSISKRKPKESDKK